jgi:hypothetical protein
MYVHQKEEKNIKICIIVLSNAKRIRITISTQ